MSIPKIQELHASFIWTESAPSLPGAEAPMALLGDREASENYFALLQGASWTALPEAAMLAPADRVALAALLGSPALAAGALDTLHWAPPWEMGQHPYRHNFWHYYRGGISPAVVTGDAAWEHLVPLRLRLPLRAANPSPVPGEPAVLISADGYAYPHGSAVEIRLRLNYEGAGVLAQYALGRLRGLRNNLVSVSLAGGNPLNLGLQALAERLLGFLRRLVWGETASAAGFKTAADPLWVVTIVKGWMTDSNAPLVAGTPLHKVLDGFCTFAPNWSAVPVTGLVPLDKANLLIGSSSGGHIGRQTAGHFVYHRPRSRLVWMPAYFTSTGPHFHKLSCYHRNLMLLSLQTEMLARALFVFNSSPEKPEALRELASAAARRISELYGSVEEKTYVSASPRAYLDEIGYTQKINEILPVLELPPLKWTPWRAAAAGAATPPASP